MTAFVPTASDIGPGTIYTSVAAGDSVTFLQPYSFINTTGTAVNINHANNTLINMTTLMSGATYGVVVNGVADCDIIAGFQAGVDLIDLTRIDATLTGNQAFSFIGTAAFGSIAGQLRLITGANSLLQGDVTGDEMPVPGACNALATVSTCAPPQKSV